jgi:nucleotide-binding universal stress UspA family protein
MNIVVAYDGSQHAKNAVTFLLRVIKPSDEIHIVTVIKEIRRSSEQKILEDGIKAEELQKEVLKELGGLRVKTVILESADVANVIIEYCKKVNCELIVTGSRGLTGLRKALLGSVSQEILSKSHVPVLISK